MTDREWFQSEMDSREKLDLHLHKLLPRHQKSMCVSGGRVRKRINSTQLSIFAYSDYEKVPTHWESFFYFTHGFCVL